MVNRAYINIIIFFILQIRFCLLFALTIGTSSLAFANYSSDYNQKLEKLIQINPEKALAVATKHLNTASNEREKLLALLYTAKSFNMLNQFAKTNEVVKQGLLLARQNHSQRFIFEFTNFTIFELELAGEFLEALNIANENYQRAIEINDDRLIAVALTTRGQMHLNLSNHQSALKDVEDSLTIFQKHHDQVNISNSFNTFAIIYADLNDFEKSIKFYKESLNADVESSYDKSTIYYNLGSTYVELKEYNTALEYFQKTIESASQYNDEYSIVFAKNGVADTYLKQKKFNEAIALYFSTAKIFKNYNDMQMLFNVNLSLSQAYIGKKEFDRALKYLAKAEMYSKKLKNKLSKINVLKTKKTLFSRQSNWNQAYIVLDELTKLEDDLYKINKEKIVQELKIKYNAQFDQEKMKLLQSKNNLKDGFIQQQKIKNKYLSVIIGLAILMLLTTFYAYSVQSRQRKRLYKLSTSDSLTGVYNRRYIVDYLKNLHSQRNSKVKAHSVVMIDLDYFKNINDTYGHDIGNKVLIYFTQIVNKHIASFGKIGRLGGEEWLLIVEGLQNIEIKKLLANIRKDYHHNVPKNIPQDCHPNFSSGVILQAHLYQDYDAILNDVDKALYKAKSSGRGKDCLVSQKT